LINTFSDFSSGIVEKVSFFNKLALPRRSYQYSYSLLLEISSILSTEEGLADVEKWDLLCLTNRY
jgi:hypothetical protein